MDQTQQVVVQTVAIPFIMYTIENGFQINPEATDFLSKLKGRLGVIAICGKYRTGKSYILNKLFIEQLSEDRAKRGFQVGPTINPCTKGLWIWKEIFYAQNDEEKETPIVIIDTEGLGAFDEDDNHDTKIFLLALLLCSIIIYNSVGSIDENVLNNLSLVVNLSKSLQIKNDSKADDPDELAEYFPSFLWILRDFALKLIDQEGNQITSKQYLENSLKEQKGVSDAIENKNRIRRLIKHFFKDRDCQTLVRPLEDEKQLQNLNNIKNCDLREEFVEQINVLRGKIWKKIKPKQLKGQIINGPMLIELAEAYVKALNGGKVPTIENAWNYMQASELERAFKEVLTEFDMKLRTQIEKNLPMTEDILKESIAKLKLDTIQSFKAKVLGDINNSKGIEYLDKLKKDFKQKYENVKKKNQQLTKDAITQMLDQCITQNIKPKVQQGLYQNFSGLKFDFEQLRNEILQSFTKGVSIKEYVYEFLFNKGFVMTEDLLADRETTLNNQLRLMQEKLKTAEGEAVRFKSELTNEKENCFKKIQDGESERIKYKTENAILTEKLSTAKIEIDELRMKLNCEYTEKLQDLELQNKVQKDEIRKRETDIMELTNENMKSSNEFNKKLALIEQERDFLKNDMGHLKEQHQRKELEFNDMIRQLKEKDEKLKQLRSKKKQMKKEITESKTLKEKYEQQVLNIQQNMQQQSTNNQNTVDSSTHDRLQKELENVRLEKIYLQNQLLAAQGQKDENKRLYETLLTVINNNQAMNSQGNNQNVKESQKGGNVKGIANTQETIERLCQMQSKMLDLEQSNQVLRNFKNLYKSASEIKCGGCQKSFKPVIFKGHYSKCTKLIEEQIQHQDSSSSTDNRLFIKLVECTAVTSSSSSDSSERQLRFFVSMGGQQWYIKTTLSNVFECVRILQKNYTSADFFKTNIFKRFVNLGDESSSPTASSTLDSINQCVQELSSLYVVKKDLQFRQLFKIDEYTGDQQTSTGKSGSTTYVSFLNSNKENNQLNLQ